MVGTFERAFDFERHQLKIECHPDPLIVSFDAPSADWDMNIMEKCVERIDGFVDAYCT